MVCKTILVGGVGGGVWGKGQWVGVVSGAQNNFLKITIQEKGNWTSFPVFWVVILVKI